MTNPRAEDEPHADRVPDPEPATRAAGEPPVDAATEPLATTEPASTAEVVGAAEPPTPTDEPASTTESLTPSDEPASTTEPLTPTDEPPAGAGTVPPPPPRRDDPPIFGGAFPPPGYGGPGFPPPGGPGFPPPSGSGFPPPGGFTPPPGTGGWATRYGLVRPAQGRVFVGVCAAIGRATNTDPVLWRVLLAVFTLAGGIGLIVYVLGWLFMPEEGDSASPVEALLGRGHSRTNPIIAVVIAIGALIGLASVFSHNVSSAIIPFGLIVLVIIVVSRHQGWYRPGGYPPSGPGMPGAGPIAPGYQPPVPPGAAQYRPPVPEPGGYAQNPGGGPLGPQPGGYRPPFAPHGPYAGPNPYPPYPGLGPRPAPVPVPPLAPVPRRPHSRLGLATMSLAFAAVGLVAVYEVVFGGVAAPVYVAVALAVVGLGLVAGAWIGRARWLIAPGILLSLALAATIGVSRVGPYEHGGGDVTWRPTSIAEISDSYSHGAGTVRLDLSRLDFTDRHKTINVHLNAGDLRVILPPNVDANVQARVGTGDARVFGTRWSGIGNGTHQVTDDGSDGPGGGELQLNLKVDLGTLEVTR